MVLIRKFLGCYRLEIGGIIIGWLGIFMQFPAIIASLASNFQLIGGNQSPLPGILLLIVSIILIAINILLLIGIEKTRSDLLLPWLIIYFKIFLVALVYGTGGLIDLMHQTSMAGLIILCIVLLALLWSFIVYSWFMILGLYEQINSLAAANINTFNGELLENDLSFPNREME